MLGKCFEALRGGKHLSIQASEVGLRRYCYKYLGLTGGNKVHRPAE